MHRTALLTGSMNPFTKGHTHVVDVSLMLFDSVVVAVGTNPNKANRDELFTAEQRMRMTAESLNEHGDRVDIRFFSGAAVDYAREINANAIVRGLRNETDQAYEASMSHANGIISELEHGQLIPTIYIPCPPSLTEISSSMVRELIGLRRSMAVLDQYVLPAVAEIIQTEIYSENEDLG